MRRLRVRRLPELRLPELRFLARRFPVRRFLGRRLVPRLVARGHRVTATTTSAAKVGLLAELGADGVVMDALDALSVGAAVASFATRIVRCRFWRPFGPGWSCMAQTSY